LAPVAPVAHRFGIKVCLLAVAKAVERNPEITRAFVEDGHEIVSHGYRWLDYQTMPEEIEREHVRLGIETIERVAGVRPVGWTTGRPRANTCRLHLELGGFLHDRDSLNDELPYWVSVGNVRHLIIPYSFETNDNRFDENRGFSTGPAAPAGSPGSSSFSITPRPATVCGSAPAARSPSIGGASIRGDLTARSAAARSSATPAKQPASIGLRHR
jgi:peptidoglycan/xylan/chitin deacetylase (PgdA/CDA1 family)